MRSGPFGQLREVVPGDQAAHRHARVRVQQRQHRGQHRAADVLEVDIDALGRRRAEQLAQVRVAVIDAGIEAERLHRVLALLRAAGDADHAAALELGDLADERADRAGGGAPRPRSRPGCGCPMSSSPT